MLPVVRNIALTCFPLLLLAPATAAAQPSTPPPASAQTLDPATEARLNRAVEQFSFDSRLRNRSSYPLWLPGQDRLIYWLLPADGKGHWVSMDAATGAKTIPIEHAELRAQLAALTGEDAPLPRGLDFALSPDGRSINFVHRDKGYALDLATRRIAALPEASLEALAIGSQVQLSPRRDMGARPTRTGLELLDQGGRVTTTLVDEEHYGWVLPDNAWSPDGGALLAWRMDARRVHKLPVVEFEGAVERVREVPYPKAGMPLPVFELHAVDPRTGANRRISFAEGEGYSFLAGWRKGAEEALVLHLSRDGKRLDLYGVTPRSGEVRRILREERPETFVGDLGFIEGDWQRQLTPLADGFLWMSERDGWRHVYRYDYSGRLRGRVTSGAFPVHEVTSVSPDGRSLLLVASANTNRPYDRLPYRVGIGGGRLVPLSSEPGVHRLYPSSTGRYFADAFSSLVQPNVREVISADGARRHRYEATDATAVREWGYRPPEPFVAMAADGRTPIHGVIFKPSDFDPSKRYPVVNYVYGGPFTTRVPYTFSGNADSRFAACLAEAGFIVVFVDTRGSPGRGKAFQDATYGRIGQIEIPDYVAAVRQAAASRPYMDIDRMGIAGYSWGGYFALRGILTAPEFYDAGYAGAPGELSEMAMVNEPNMGLPPLNPEGYRLGSNIAAAGQLRGALRMIHGTSDTDAPLTTTLRMSDALIRAGKRFELLLIPGAGHSPGDPVLPYFIRDLSLFFMRQLGEPQPAAAPR